MEMLAARLPPLSWSYSRNRLLDECPRAYYWRYYGSYGGWMNRADGPARLGWRLRHLTTLHAVFGQALHSCARDCAAALRERIELPTQEVLVDRVRTALHAACAASLRRDAFVADPKRNPMLHSVYYKGCFDDKEVEAVRGKLEPCVRHLLASSVWDEARALPPGGIEIVDLLDAVEFQGLMVYAAPDLVLSGPGHRCTIVDWKTGKRSGDDAAEAQLAVYSWYVQKRLGLTLRDEPWIGRVVYLQEGEEEQSVITRLDVIRAEHRIVESVEGMRQYLDAQPSHSPPRREAFPLVAPAFRFRCSQCRFYQLCQSELCTSEG